MFRGEYNFFDYKYNIIGYNGQDFGNFPQYLYLIISFILMIIILFSLKNLKKEKVHNILKITSIFLVLFYIIKTTWESIYDIKLSGSFNTGLLPFDTCSLIMIAGLISSYSKGKIKEYSDSWLVTGGIIGGFATMIVLNAFKYYPFLSFGAFYSMIWHFLMVFIGLLLIITKYIDMNYKVVIKGFIFQFMFSLIIIPIDFIFNMDIMMYKNLGGIPLFENIATYLTSIGLSILNPLLMLTLYFIVFHIPYLIYMMCKRFNKILK